MVSLLPRELKSGRDPENQRENRTRRTREKIEVQGSRRDPENLGKDRTWRTRKKTKPGEPERRFNLEYKGLDGTRRTGEKTRPGEPGRKQDPENQRED